MDTDLLTLAHVTLSRCDVDQAHMLVTVANVRQVPLTCGPCAARGDRPLIEVVFSALDVK